MSISHYKERLEKIENTVNSMFGNQRIGLDDDALDFVVGPLNQKDWHSIGAWFEIAVSDLGMVQKPEKLD